MLPLEVVRLRHQPGWCDAAWSGIRRTCDAGVAERPTAIPAAW